MQDRYAGDIGDFGKLALLKALAREGLSIGVNWYKTEPAEKEALNADGKFLIPERFAVCDPELAGKLHAISSGDNRSIAALEKADILPDAAYYSKQITVEKRQEWHQEALKKLSNVDLVFLDPDNGLLVKSVGKKSAKSIKYVFSKEISDYLKNGRSVLLYQHRCRKKPAHYFGAISTDTPNTPQKFAMLSNPLLMENGADLGLLQIAAPPICTVPVLRE